MSESAAQVGKYTRVNVETASQGKLVVMLFNGAIKRAEEAKRQLANRRHQEVHNNLIRAQEIIGELRAALNMEAGDIAKNLDRVYEYFQHLLINANVTKNGANIDECVTLMTSMRDTWQEVFEKVTHEKAPVKPKPVAVKLHNHGAAVLNLQG